MRTDQDHALSFEGDRGEAWAGARAAREFITAGLESGFARCEANVMATNDALRHAAGLGRPVRPLDERAEREGERNGCRSCSTSARSTATRGRRPR